MRVSRRAIGALAALLVCTVVGSPSPARAGTYTVAGTCGLWQPYNNSPGWVAVFPSCPELVARNVGGLGAAPQTVEGGWIMYAPAGTSVYSFAVQGTLVGTQGWQASMYLAGSGPFEDCPGPNCPGATKYLNLGWWYAGNNAGAIVLRLRCGGSSCARATTYGYAGLTGAYVTLFDGTPPGVAITGGDLTSGWRHGTATVTYDAGDNTGIKAVRGYLDGRPRAEVPRNCNYYGTLIPCPNGGGSLALDTTGLSDGAHQLAVNAVDSADNPSSAQTTVYTDNTAPGSPGSVTLDGGDGWRASGAFGVHWTNPPQNASPIVAANYVLCPASNAAGDRKGCVEGTRAGANISALKDIEVPRPGEWKLSVYLADAAGNADIGSAVTVKGLRLDTDRPAASFVPISAEDPTRIRVTASDATSGIASMSLEIQRDGTTTWTEMPITQDASGFSAPLDDGALPQGLYHLRARVIDAAGNDRTIETFEDGQPATLALPVRLKTRLAVGRVKHVLAKSSRHGKKRYRRVLVDKPRSRYGRTVRLSGRLTTPGANPVAGQPVEVWEQIELPGAQWALIATVQTSRTGRFVFKALRGPSRLLQFQYHGTAKIRSRISTVDLRVKATSSLRVNRHHVNNGDFVSFHGRLKGHPIPAGGKLIELQVYTRGQWRTFAQPRANATSGLWGYRYRFEAINGRVRFRFRARIRKEATYPFDLGTSRQVRVTVRGA